MVADKLFGSFSVKLKVLMVIAIAVGLLVVAGPPAGAQASCHSVDEFIDVCLDKTASPNPVNVGQQFAFTIRAFCKPNAAHPTLQCSGAGGSVTDTLPSGLRFVSATASGVDPADCPTVGNIVTCTPITFCTGEGACRLAGADGSEEVDFVETITIIPTQCETFTNTATDSSDQITASTDFTVNCPVAPPGRHKHHKHHGHHH